MFETPFLVLNKLTLAYGDTVAVRDLDLIIGGDELVALLGPSGCGKTTTMRSIAGLMTPSSGHIMLDGRDITHVPAHRRGVGLVFQSYALFPHLSIFENVAFGLRLRKIRGSDLETRVSDGLRSVGLLDLSKRKPATLSGGQQQRVALARALVMEPKLLLLDEPLSNLDARLRLDMRGELQRVRERTGIPMIFVTHDQQEALALADRIVVLRDGAIEQIGTPDELYNRPQSSFVADFFGFENVFAVREGALVTPAGPVALGDEDLADVAGLAWRPAAVALGHGPFVGTVCGSSYSGATREYLLDSALGTIKAEANAASEARHVGETLAFGLPIASAAKLRRFDR
ncbi:ABC transporter ATP-binding protein [Sphingomonas bacterium]|uniref:ABC transporter ATP-binding protein n=1 Tax=Sphingomonas bacterium TaxID=1895847 RepID=UPI0015772BAE|nr:ABC transporter ATP-binding protein [Sphingomonas bacterium]